MDNIPLWASTVEIHTIRVSKTVKKHSHTVLQTTGITDYMSSTWQANNFPHL